MDTLSLQGKIIAVTGGGSGIGESVATTIRARGAIVSIADINPSGLERVAAIFGTDGPKYSTTVLDVRDDAAVVAWIDATVKQFGRLDGAANCAGALAPIQTLATVENTLDEDWDYVMDINLKGVFRCMRAELRNMNDGGSIVNIASVLGINASPNQAIYGASKAGVISITKSAAREVGLRNIRVNAIAPGIIETPLLNHVANMTPDRFGGLVQAQPLKRRGTPEEMAKLIAYLLCDESSYTTGAVHVADGGSLC